MTTKKSDYPVYLNQLEDTLDEYLIKKAPELPTGVKEFIVQFGPWITLILLILAAPALLALLGIGAILTPFSFVGGVGAGFSYIITIVFSIVIIVLEAMAIPGLFSRSRKGWNLLYYSTLLSGLQSLLTMNLFGLVIGTLISLYLLFQVKSYYK